MTRSRLNVRIVVCAFAGLVAVLLVYSTWSRIRAENSREPVAKDSQSHGLEDLYSEDIRLYQGANNARAVKFGRLRNAGIDFKRVAGKHTYARPGSVEVQQFAGAAANEVSTRHNACILVYVRNMDQVCALLNTIRTVEANFNSEYEYPWVIVRDGRWKLTNETRDAIVNATSGLVEFVRVSTPPSDSTLFQASTDIEDQLTFKSKDYNLHRDQKLTYVKRTQQLRMGDQFPELELAWDYNMFKQSSLSDSHSISVARFLTSDIFRLDEVRKYDYFLKLEPGTMLDCKIAYDLFSRFSSHPNANAGVVFMDKIQDPSVSARLGQAISSIQDWKNIRLSHYFCDQNNTYNSVIMDTETFFIGKTSFFNTDNFLSFIRYMDKMRVMYNEAWTPSEVISVYFAMVFNEKRVTMNLEGNEAHKMTSREDILIFEDLGVSDNSALLSGISTPNLGNSKASLYMLSKRSCPLSTSQRNQFVIRNALGCDCNVDDRLFFKDFSAALTKKKEGSVADFSKIYVKDVPFEEFQTLLMSQMAEALWTSNKVDKIPQFLSYFRSIFQTQSAALFDIKLSITSKLEWMKEMQDKQRQKLVDSRELKVKTFMKTVRELQSKSKKEMDKTSKELQKVLVVPEPSTANGTSSISQ